MYMYKHVIKHTRSIKYICYLWLCNINKQFSPKYISMNNNKNIWNFKVQNISKTQFIENEIVQIGVACWEGPWQCMLGDCHGYFYRMIWFLQLPAKDLSGNTMAFSSITSEGTWTLLPMKSKTTGAWTKS